MKFFILFILLTSFNSYSKESLNILIIDTGVDKTHPLVSKFRVLEYLNKKIDEDHGTHLFCILTRNLDPQKFKFTSINYKKIKINTIISKVQNIKFDYVLYAIGDEKYQKEELDLFNMLIEKNPSIKIITSAGNNSKKLGITKYYPCSYELKNIECIGNNYSYSNYGKNVKIIKSPKEFESCSLNKGYSIKKGTSQTSAYYLNKILLDR